MLRKVMAVKGRTSLPPFCCVDLARIMVLRAPKGRRRYSAGTNQNNLVSCLIFLIILFLLLFILLFYYDWAKEETPGARQGQGGKQQEILSPEERESE